MSRKHKLKDSLKDSPVLQLSLTFDTVVAPVDAGPIEPKKMNVISFASYSRSDRNSVNSDSVIERLLREAKRLNW